MSTCCGLRDGSGTSRSSTAAGPSNRTTCTARMPVTVPGDTTPLITLPRDPRSAAGPGSRQGAPVQLVFGPEDLEEYAASGTGCGCTSSRGPGAAASRWNRRWSRPRWTTSTPRRAPRPLDARARRRRPRGVVPAHGRAAPGRPRRRPDRLARPDRLPRRTRLARLPLRHPRRTCTRRSPTPPRRCTTPSTTSATTTSARSGPSRCCATACRPRTPPRSPASSNGCTRASSTSTARRCSDITRRERRTDPQPPSRPPTRRAAARRGAMLAGRRLVGRARPAARLHPLGARRPFADPRRQAAARRRPRRRRGARPRPLRPRPRPHSDELPEIVAAPQLGTPGPVRPGRARTAGAGQERRAAAVSGRSRCGSARSRPSAASASTSAGPTCSAPPRCSG